MEGFMLRACLAPDEAAQITRPQINLGLLLGWLNTEKLSVALALLDALVMTAHGSMLPIQVRAQQG
jgi:hypothetical protein